MDFSSILTGIGSVATGGIAGGLFSLIGLGIKSWANYKEQKEQNRHQEEMLEISRKAAAEEAKYRLQIADKEIESHLVEGKLDIIEQGYKTDAAESKALSTVGGVLAKIGLFYKATVRPTLAYATTVFIIVLFYKISKLVGGLNSLDSKTLIDIYKGLISSITGFWTAVGMYYFFNRPIKHK